MMPRVVLCSMWRNDSRRNLPDRAEHLLAKAAMYPNLRWVWVVGDSTDSTLVDLMELAHGYDVALRRQDSGIVGDDGHSRLRRLSYTGNAIFSNMRPGDDYLVVHESDICSPYDLIPRLVAHAEAGRCPVGTWPVITLPGAKAPQLYDIWALRKDGVRFEAHWPYHNGYHHAEPFTVDSFGTVWMMAAGDAQHIHMTDGAVLDACAQLRALGRELWVDPQLIVEQPVELWTWRNLEVVGR